MLIIIKDIINKPETPVIANMSFSLLTTGKNPFVKASATAFSPTTTSGRGTDAVAPMETG